MSFESLKKLTDRVPEISESLLDDQLELEGGQVVRDTEAESIWADFRYRIDLRSLAQPQKLESIDFVTVSLKAVDLKTGQTLSLIEVQAEQENSKKKKTCHYFG